MPPRSHSRHLFTQGIRDERGRLFLSERTPFDFRELSDTRRHTVVLGDTLWSLAGRYSRPSRAPAVSGGPSPTFSPSPSSTRPLRSPKVACSSSHPSAS